MARFTVVHGIAPHITQDQIVEGSRGAIRELATGTEWLNSWVAAQADTVFCEWEAPDADAIRASLESTTDVLPIQAIYEVERLDPQWYG